MITLNQARRRSAMLSIAASAALVACGGGGGGGGTTSVPAGTGAVGTLQVALTDAPACGFDEVNVTVERVRVHQSMGASENDQGWRDIVPVAPQKVDLLSLQNGVLVDLGQTTLPVGQYTQMRLILSANGAASPANYVLVTGGTMEPVAMDTPSAQRSGIKLIHGFTVEENKTTSLVLDFDACKSIVRRGNGSYGLKPVIGIMPMTLTKIVGYVETGVKGVNVSAQKDGVVYRATQPNASGQFVLGPVDPTKGQYDVVIAGKDRTTAVISGVPVAAEQTTTLNGPGNAVSMPTSPSGSVSDTVSPAAAAATGSVRALQTVGGVAAVETAHTNTDTTTGMYSLSLPTAAPRLLAYSNPLATPLNFQVQGANAAKYRLEASASGYKASLGSEIIAVDGTPKTGQDFTLVP